MRIGIVNDFFPPDFVGGVEYNLADVSRALIADGNQVFGLSLGRGLRFYDDFPVHRFKPLYPPTISKLLLLDPFAWRQTISFIRRYSPDLLFI